MKNCCISYSFNLFCFVQLVASKSDKNIWRHCITPKQREDEKKEIMKLQKRADFLKNPRFTLDTRSLVKTVDRATSRYEHSLGTTDFSNIISSEMKRLEKKSKESLLLFFTKIDQTTIKF